MKEQVEMLLSQIEDSVKQLRIILQSDTAADTLPADVQQVEEHPLTPDAKPTPYDGVAPTTGIEQEQPLKTTAELMGELFDVEAVFSPSTPADVIDSLRAAFVSQFK